MGGCNGSAEVCMENKYGIVNSLFQCIGTRV